MDIESSFVLEVVGYELIGDNSGADNHIFTIQCWVAQDVFTIERSYANFCEFDARLHRRYPRSKLPDFPLAASLTPKIINTVIRPGNKKGTIKKAENSTEIVSQKKGPLSTYLMALLAIPEITLSNDLVVFLDVESEDGDELNQSSVSPIEYILRNEKPQTVKVIRKRAISVNVNTGQFIAWRFFTKGKDIGFTIQIDSKDILPYQRYNSHEETIEGLIEVPRNGEATIFWDNSYSKVRSKLLTFVYRTIDASEFAEISSICGNLTREKHDGELKRNAVRRSLAARSERLLATSDVRMSMIGGPDSSRASHGGSDVLFEELTGELDQLRNEKGSLQVALSAAEATVSSLQADIALMRAKEVDEIGLTVTVTSLRNEKNDLEEEISRLKEVNKALTDDLSAAQEESKTATQQIDELHRQSKRDANAQMSQHQQQASLREKIFELSAEQEKLQSANAVLDAQVQRLKSEKKQLKAYALQVKESAEVTQRAVDEWEGKKSTLENLLFEILPLREELRNQIKCLENMKNKYVFSNDGKTLDETLVEGTDISLFSASNSVGSADMLSEFAELKGYSGKESAAHSVPTPTDSAESKGDVSSTRVTVAPNMEPAKREREQSDDILESMLKKMSAVSFDNLFS